VSRKIKILIIFVTFSFLLFLFGQKEGLNVFYPKPAKLIFVGDIMLSRQIGVIINQEQDPLFPFLRITERIQNADIAFANLEGPASTQGTDQGSEYSFRAEPDTLKGLSFAGFNVVSVANNHSFDWGPLAFQDTISYLKKNSVLSVGGGDNFASAHTPARIEKNGEVFCFLGYSQFANDYVSGKDSSPSMAKLDIDQMTVDINKAKTDSCTNIIISIHWGNEYEIHPQDSQRVIAHALIDAGANLVIGHHPHVIQDVESYKNGLIAYSLGNFVFDQNFSEDTRKGMMLEVIVNSGKIVSYTSDIIRFTEKFQPYVSQE
jgi:poly-gamma-glutamate synthesis protein (capsule biosynthesis protein)